MGNVVLSPQKVLQILKENNHKTIVPDFVIEFCINCLSPMFFANDGYQDFGEVTIYDKPIQNYYGKWFYMFMRICEQCQLVNFSVFELLKSLIQKITNWDIKSEGIYLDVPFLKECDIVWHQVCNKYDWQYTSLLREIVEPLALKCMLQIVKSEDIPNPVLQDLSRFQNWNRYEIWFMHQKIPGIKLITTSTFQICTDIL